MLDGRRPTVSKCRPFVAIAPWRAFCPRGHLGAGHSRFLVNRAIQNLQIALQSEQRIQVGTVGVFEKANLDTQLVPLVAQIDQRAVHRLIVILSHV
jgi:hypothetical protein